MATARAKTETEARQGKARRIKATTKGSNNLSGDTTSRPEPVKSPTSRPGTPTTAHSPPRNHPNATIPTHIAISHLETTNAHFQRPAYLR